MEGWRGTDGLVASNHIAGVIHEKATRKIGNLYPKVTLPKQYGGTENNVIAWIWARTVASPDPAAHGKHIPLLSTRMLSTKPGKMSWISTALDGSANGWSPVVKSGDLQKDDLAKAKLGTKAGKAQDFICLLQKTPVQRSYIQNRRARLGRRLVRSLLRRGVGSCSCLQTPSTSPLGTWLMIAWMRPGLRFSPVRFPLAPRLLEECAPPMDLTPGGTCFGRDRSSHS